MPKIIFSLFCLLAIFQAQAQIIDFSLGFDQKAICNSDSIDIYTESSQIGVDYYLMDTANNIIQGPIGGTGGVLTFNIGPIAATQSFIVKAIGGNASYEVVNNDVRADTNNRGVDQFVSIAARIKTSDLTTAPTHKVVSKQYSNFSTGYGYSLDLSFAGYARMSSYGDIANSSGNGSTYIANGQWHYLVGTIDLVNGIWNIYVDGVLESSDTLTVPSGTLASFPFLSFVPDNDLNIKFDEVTIWNRIISATEVQSFMNTCLSGTEPNVVAHFKMNRGFGNTFTDYSPLGIHASASSSGSNNAWSNQNMQACSDTLYFSDTLVISPLGTSSTNIQLYASTNLRCPGDSAIITSDTSQLGIAYFLIDTLSHSTIDGPIQGTGSGLSFETGPIQTTTSYQVTANESFPHALSFDGVDDYLFLDFPDNTFSAPVAVAAWIKMDSSSSNQVIFQHDYIQLSVDNQGRATVASTEAGGGDHLVFAHSTTLVDDNEWHYIVAVVNQDAIYGAAMTIYVDAILEGTNQVVYSTLSGFGRYIGCTKNPFSPTTSDHYKGELAELAFFGTYLTPSQIQSYHYNCFTRMESGLEAYYSFEQIAGNSIIDLSPHSIHGQAFNMNTANAQVNGYSPCFNSCVVPHNGAPITIDIEDMSLNYISTINSSTLETNLANATYQWLDCNNNYAPIGGATSQSYAPTMDGSYAVSTTLANGCTDISNCKYFSLTAVSKIAAESIEIYPNPSNNLLNIKTNAIIESIQVYTASGVLVKNVTPFAFKQLSVANLPQGFYFLKIKTTRGLLQHPFVKN